MLVLKHPLNDQATTIEEHHQHILGIQNRIKTTEE